MYTAQVDWVFINNRFIFNLLMAWILLLIFFLCQISILHGYTFIRSHCCWFEFIIKISFIVFRHLFKMTVLMVRIIIIFNIIFQSKISKWMIVFRNWIGSFGIFVEKQIKWSFCYFLFLFWNTHFVLFGSFLWDGEQQSGHQLSGWLECSPEVFSFNFRHTSIGQFTPQIPLASNGTFSLSIHIYI